MLQRMIRNFFIFEFLGQFAISLSFASYVLFLQDNGLTFLEMGIVNFVYMIAVFILEIPTGAIADLFGRKNSIIIGYFISALGSLFYFFSYSMLGFIFSEIILALGLACISGANQALLTDNLKFNGYKDKVAKIFTKRQMIMDLAVISGGLISGIILIFSFRLSWLFVTIFMLITAFVSMKLLQEEYFEKKDFNLKQAFRQMKVIIKESTSYGVKNKFVFVLILLGMVYSLSVQGVNMQWSLLFEKNIGKWIIGLVWFGIKVFSILGTWLAQKMLNKDYSEKKILGFTILQTGLLILLSAVFQNIWLVLIFFWVHEIGRGAWTPTRQGYIQEHIPSKQRATIGSFDSMFMRLGAGIGLLISGLLADYFSIQMSWFFSAVVMFSCLVFLKFLPNGELES